MSAIEFKETQRVTNWLIWALLIGINLFFAYAIVYQNFLDSPLGKQIFSNTELSIIAFIPLTLLVFVYSIRLETCINEKGITYSFSPLQRSTVFIEWEELSNVYLRKYNTVKEFGGRGVLTGSTKLGKVLNTSASSNIGLQLEFKNGKLLLIGTAKPDELKKVLDKLMLEGKIGWKV